MNKKFYITTPLYYVNAAPHIGHSYTNIAADTLARYMRKLKGEENVWFLTGTDEHGQKIQKAALDAGMNPKEFCDKMVLQFEGLWKSLNISHNDFIRTTQDRHVKFVQKALEILYRNKQVYLDIYEGWYCTPCERFWTDSELLGGNCPDCKRAVEKISEKNYFLKLSAHQDWLLSHIKKNIDFIRPKYRYNEVLSFLELNKLNDLCISRPKERLSWGIPLPFSPEHVTYVWLDALINYISAVGEFDSQGNYKSRWWPADLHLIGKDILRQHAVYWPIILKALNLEPPKTIFAHGWWLIQDTKMSKSLGNVVNPINMVNKFGIDVYRYFLLRDVPFGLDGNFSEEAIIKRFNSDLANDLGNLVYRTLTMVEKYFNGKIPREASLLKDKQADAITAKIKSLKEPGPLDLSANTDYNFSACLQNFWELINLANKYVEETKPWNLSKEGKSAELEGFINLLVKVIRIVSDNIEPFMPQTSTAIRGQFGEREVKKGKPLFPRIES